jgi:cardiolipin synthase
MIAAGLSDGLDGLIARHFDGRSELGAILDPLADKTLLNGIYVALALVTAIPGWLAALVVGRDLLIVLGAIVIRHRNPVYQPRPLLVGKLNTFAQIVLAVCTLAHLSNYIELAEQIDALIVGVAVTTLASGLGYAVQGLRAVRASEPDPA